MAAGAAFVLVRIFAGCASRSVSQEDVPPCLLRHELLLHPGEDSVAIFRARKRGEEGRERERERVRATLIPHFAFTRTRSRSRAREPRRLVLIYRLTMTGKRSFDFRLASENERLHLRRGSNRELVNRALAISV